MCVCFSFLCCALCFVCFFFEGGYSVLLGGCTRLARGGVGGEGSFARLGCSSRSCTWRMMPQVTCLLGVFSVCFSLVLLSSRRLVANVFVPCCVSIFHCACVCDTHARAYTECLWVCGPAHQHHGGPLGLSGVAVVVSIWSWSSSFVLCCSLFLSGFWVNGWFVGLLGTAHHPPVGGERKCGCGHCVWVGWA